MFDFSRSPDHTEEKLKPFDWTFSSDYMGTVNKLLKATPTDEKINIERLKEKEKILFYHDLMLYEDELHDNGIASCTVKIVNIICCLKLTKKLIMSVLESNAKFIFYTTSLLPSSR